MKSIRRAIAIVLLFAVLTSLPVLAASDGLFCSFDTSGLILETGSIYTVSGIVYSHNLHITGVSVSIYTPSSGEEDAYSICVLTGDENGADVFDLTDCYEFILGEPGDYLIRWTAFTKEGVGFDHPIEKRITAVDESYVGIPIDDDARISLGEAEGAAEDDASVFFGEDDSDPGVFVDPGIIPQPIPSQDEAVVSAAEDYIENPTEQQSNFADEDPSFNVPDDRLPTLRTSEKGIAFIKAWESCRLYVYDDATNKRWDANSKGNPTIGYGHKLVSGDGLTTSSTITLEEAEALFLQDLARREAVCNEFLRLTGAEVTQNQYDALSSLFYNGNGYALDSSSFMFRLFSSNAKSISDIPAWKIYNQFANYYTRSNASVRKGLLMRRLDEARIFTDAIYERFDWIIPDWAARGEVVPDEWYPEELGSPTPGDTRTEGDAPTAAVAPVSVFTDLPASDPCYNAVHRLALRGIITGTGGSKFSPSKTLTRAEACALICKLLGQGAKSPCHTSFSDVPTSHWGSGYIAWCTENGLLSGYGGGSFGPDDPLTVNQLGKILVSVLGEDDAALRKGGWPDGWSSMARELGLLEGVDCDGSSQIPRKYAAVMLDNAINEQTHRLLQSPLLSGSLVGHSSGSDGVVYIQTDSRWSGDTYGYCDGKPATFYNSACGVFSVANAIHHITGHAFTDDEIRELAAFSVRKEYRVDDQGTELALTKGAAEEYGRKLGFRTDETVLYYGNNREVIRNIDCCLDCGGAIVFSVRTSNNGGHLMTIVDRRLTRSGTTEYLLLDSYDSSNRLGSGVNSGWVTMDAELDLHSASGNRIITKGGERLRLLAHVPHRLIQCS